VFVRTLRNFSNTQANVVAASYLAWALDAYDFFLLVFVFKDISAQFRTSITYVAIAVTLTLACRPIGAIIFGRLADRFGRRPILMVDIALYSLLNFAIAFTPNIHVFWLVCACFGVAMGGVWGIGASLAMETIKPEARGFVSGLLQAGYPTGYLFASLVYGLLYTEIGWRGMFMVGIVPASVLIFYIWRKVPESPTWKGVKAQKSVMSFSAFRRHWKIALYAVVLMTAYNFFSHGTQDLYPTFLEKQHGFGHRTVSIIAVIYNIGAIIGGVLFGSLSQKLGRRRTAIMTTLLSIPTIVLWAYAPSAVLLAIGAFFMQFFVQGAYGIVPAHLNELSPPGARGTFPGTVYQLGNLIASVNAIMQASIAERAGGNYSVALAVVALGAALAIAITVKFGPEAHSVEFHPKSE